MTEENNHKLSSDIPKSDLSEDEFGLSELVGSTANAIERSFNERGYVIGIEGEWGSGKTTFSNFVVNNLLSRRNTHIKLLRFEPWLIGEKHFLLSAFLGHLAIEVDSLVKYPVWKIHKWRQIYRRHSLSRKIREYGEYLGALATPVGALATIDATGYSGAAALGLRSLSAITKQFGKKGKTVEDLKHQIIDQLKLLRGTNEANFLVVIDDTDRLDPNEAAEVLRLVRKVADFPGITYLLCFDEKLLCEQVEKAHQISDGRAFLQKILQLQISIPPLEPFALRRYAKRRLKEEFPEEVGKAYSPVHGLSHRHSVLFDRWFGKFLATPRDVSRLLESAKASWPRLKSLNLDFADFIWLQLIKLKFPKLYDWTKRYLTTVGAYRDRGGASTGEDRTFASELKSMLTPHHWQKAAYESGIDQFLPGCSDYVLEGDASKVFNFSYGELSGFEKGRRLGSPSHWRYYFAFDMPSYAINDAEISAFLEAARKCDGSAAKMLLMLSRRAHEKAGHYVDSLLDRLTDLPRDSFSADEQFGFLQAFSESMDTIARDMREFEENGRSEIWSKTSELMNRNAAQNFNSFVDSGQSLGWLAQIIRDQGFAIGLAGSRSADESKKWLSEAQVRSAVTSLSNRVKVIGAKKALQLPGSLGILFCWLQLGEPNDLRTFLEDECSDDEVFLLALQAMRGWSFGSDGVRHPLHKDYVQNFMDADVAKERLTLLATNSRFSTQANDLLSDWSTQNML